MCELGQLFGTGMVLEIQLAALFAIAVTALFWLGEFRKRQISVALFRFPLLLWAIFGTLDMTITAKGVLEGAPSEGFWLAKLAFGHFGAVGPVVASVLWISLWAGVVLALNRTRPPFYSTVSLMIFYALAISHFFGFSSWLVSACWVARPVYGTMPDFSSVGTLLAVPAAIIHTILAEKGKQ
jgi:hypothetical protein